MTAGSYLLSGADHVERYGVVSGHKVGAYRVGSIDCRRRHLRLRGGGRNMNGLRVMEAFCRRCGWNHMTAYRRRRKVSAVMYLRRRWEEHRAD